MRLRGVMKQPEAQPKQFNSFFFSKKKYHEAFTFILYAEQAGWCKFNYDYNVVESSNILLVCSFCCVDHTSVTHLPCSWYETLKSYFLAAKR